LSHLSESSFRLKEQEIDIPSQAELQQPNCWFLRLPFYENSNSILNVGLLVKEINSFINSTDKQSTICLYTSPYFAAKLISKLSKKSDLKLWIAVKNQHPKIIQQIPQAHSSLLIITRYKSALQHTKTRIGYSFCPSCEKTTKDYGGKKHLYNEFGTLMSDVWRDIEVNPSGDLKLITNRLSDLFAVSPYTNLNCLDLTDKYPNQNIEKKYSLKIPKRTKAPSSSIINGDCIEELKKLPSNSIDFCFADPPYNVKKKYENWNDDIDFIQYFKWCNEWIAELSRIVKPGGIVSILNIPQWTAQYITELEKKLDYLDWIVWESLSLPVRMVMPAHYSIICFSKGKPNIPVIQQDKHLQTLKEWFCVRNSCKRKRNLDNSTESTSNIWWDIHRLKHNSRRVEHPTQLPPEFMKRLISLFSIKGDTILDPFNGSGTTTLCAEQLDRNFIGIEQSEIYYKLALSRHDEIAKGLDPFRKESKVLKSKNNDIKRVSQRKYDVDKKTLQLDVRAIAQKLGRIPNRDDVLKNSKYPIKYFDEYFANWASVTAAARTTGMAEVENIKDYKLKY
jgi:DNA modification methylase